MSRSTNTLKPAFGGLRANGIIYAGRRGETEKIARHLNKRGYQADFYHAGLSATERKGVQDRFFNDGADGVDLVVSTNAFGMGIDKPNIRYVIHWTMTGHSGGILSGSRTRRSG